LQTTSAGENETQVPIEDPVQAEAVETLEGFRALGVTDVMLAALTRAGFTDPSPVQAQMIPSALAGRDCLANAPTGTGKTAAFLLPVLEKIDDRDRNVQALILAPTRELAHQIGREFDKLSHGRRCRAVAVVGGESIYQQQRLLGSGSQLVIATPGRLMDLLERRAIRLDKVKVVVLDEADQMLDIGFRPAVEAILGEIPGPRQTLLLSATMPKGVRDLSKMYLVDPVHIRLIQEDEDATIPAIRQAYIMVEPSRKFDLLVELLRREQPPRAIVFCRTKHGADRLGESLHQAGFAAAPMHGDLSQAQRNRTLHAFRQGRMAILVATDVVGRGIDVPDVSHVINYDMPEDPSYYVHRIGRTGRMGKDGAAFSFVVPEQGKLLDQIEREISRTIDRDEVEGVFSPNRPVFRAQRPAGNGRRGGGNGGGNGGGRPNRFGGGNGAAPRPARRGGSNGTVPVGGGIGIRRRRDRSTQGVN